MDTSGDRAAYNGRTVSTLTAFILVGGLGTRLRSVVQDRPKVLATVNSRPFLAYLFDQLVDAGVRRAILCIGYRGEQIRDQFGAAYGPLTLVHSSEPTALGTAGALRHALPLAASDPVLVLNGDSFCQVDISDFLARHLSRGGQGSLVLTHATDAGRYGRVPFGSQGEILEFAEDAKSSVVGNQEAPKSEGDPESARQESDRLGGWINGGVYLLGQKLISSIPSGRSVSLEREVLPSWVGRGLYGYPSPGPFVDIGIPRSYLEAQRFFAALPIAAGAQL